MDRGDGVFGSNTLTQIRDLLPLLTLPIMVLGCKDTDVACSMLDNGCNDVIKSAEPGLDLVSRVKLQTRLRMEHLIEVARVREEQSAYSLLPLSVINRINNGESQILDRLEEVTIMHCSVVDVPGMSELMSPSSAMHLLTKVLNHMDRLSESHLYHRVHASGKACIPWDLLHGIPAGARNQLRQTLCAPKCQRVALWIRKRLGL